MSTFTDKGEYEAITLRVALGRVGINPNRIPATPERLETLVAWGERSKELNLHPACNGAPGSIAGGPVLFQWNAVGGNPERGRPYFLLNQCEAVVFDDNEYAYRLARLC